MTQNVCVSVQMDEKSFHDFASFDLLRHNKGWQRPVVFTATRDKVWVRFADASGQQLLQKELAMGESWTVPAGVEGVTLTTARPDGLAITIAGRAVPPLSTTEQTMRDVPVTGAALLARGTASAAPVSTPTASQGWTWPTTPPTGRGRRPSSAS